VVRVSLVATGHVALLAVSTLTTAALAAYAWHNRAEHGARAFAGLMLSFTLYSGGHLVGLLTLDPVWRLVWDGVKWTGTAAVPVFWVLFVVEYTGYDEFLDRRTAGLLSVLPLLTVGLAWTNSLHRLVWTSRDRVAVVDGLAILVDAVGPWIWVFAVFSYVVVGVSSLLLLRLILVSDYLYTSQATLLLLGIVVPAVASAATLAEVTRLGPVVLNVTPYAFIVTGPAFGYALFRHRLFDLVPAARQLGRSAAIRDLEDGVLILDTTRRVIYCNEAATDLLDADREAVLGEPARSLVDESALNLDTEDALAELERSDSVYEVRSSPIRGRSDELIGHTLVVRDITGRKRREERLTRQRDELARLDELNAVIRGVNRALVSATTREEIETAVCEHLTERDLYGAACVADVPTWNGDADRWTLATDGGTVEELPQPEDDGDGNGRGVGPDDGMPSPDPPGSLDIGDDSGVVEDRSWTVVPLSYGRTVYGALGLQPRSDAVDPVTEREREVLAELGELIGQAIDAVESRRLLSAESIVELTFVSTDSGEPLIEAASHAERLTLTGLVPDAGQGHLAYVGVEGGSAAAVAETLAADPAASTRVIRGDEEGGEGGLVEWTVPAETVLGTLVARGAKMQTATVEDGTARYAAEVASGADVRALIERVQAAYPDTRLASMTERDRPVERADSVPRETVEDLTDRQQEALEAAYRAGYYDWPRESTGEEIAETLDISAPTLHAHLRKAEDSLLSELFDQERDRPRGD
jgi:PAS domain-containing protein